MKLKNVCKSYKKKGKNISVLQDLSYSFRFGKLYAIFGESGSGKTTLIYILGLLEKVTSGSYILDKVDVTKLNRKELISLHKNNIGYVSQSMDLNDYLNSLENVLLPMLVNSDISKDERTVIAKKLLKKFGLEKRMNHYPKELSGGEKQRVCIARALANRPKYLLCDEPTSSLDKRNTIKVFQLLKDLSQEGLCVIVVSHDEKVFDYADYCLELKDGKLTEVSNVSKR